MPRPSYRRGQTRTWPSGGVAVTHNRSSMPPMWCLPTGELLGASLPSTGSSRALVPPIPRYYQGTATPCHPSRRASLPSLGGTTGTRMFRSRRRCVWPTASLGLFTRDPLPGISSVETTGSPKFLGNLACPFAMLQDSGGTPFPDHSGRSRGPGKRNCQGSREYRLSKLTHGFWAGCLRFAVPVARSPRKTRFQLLVRLSWAGFPPARFR